METSSVSSSDQLESETEPFATQRLGGVAQCQAVGVADGKGMDLQRALILTHQPPCQVQSLKTPPQSSLSIQFKIQPPAFRITIAVNSGVKQS